jgi:hypothetical protein
MSRTQGKDNLEALPTWICGIRVGTNSKAISRTFHFPVARNFGCTGVALDAVLVIRSQKLAPSTLR